MKVTVFFAMFRLIEAQKKRVKLGELHSWSHADVLSDIEAMPLKLEETRPNIVAAVKKNTINGKVMCDFEVCMCFMYMLFFKTNSIYAKSAHVSVFRRKKS